MSEDKEYDNLWVRVVAMSIKYIKCCKKKLADKFQVAESTVEHWADGTAVPHPDIQKMIIEAIVLISADEDM